MRAGQYRHRVTIKRKVATRDVYGGEVITWTELATVWGQVRPVSGREYLDSKQAQAEVTHRVNIRHGVAVKPAMRVYFGTRAFEIESVVQPDERPIEIRMMCRELLNE